tara:strand:+ start:361 stop:552 length:192 start_codon:yes stop_codon:yes gene_type:complete
VKKIINSLKKVIFDIVNTLFLSLLYRVKNIRAINVINRSGKNGPEINAAGNKINSKDEINNKL